eukprot:CAMPEP_0175092104 /NCGR_PEP_ID=MMETSP0086_2-20121207/2279_1 /TAXON_ID=136419 /ORGANISM="Unknown Unknown, Strain D1" /LENGTH=355 /DNA_ID=CAMNT_0016364933 /DNA_START=23 /DNA_END=1087 /DNA_ORIENTATION=+
MGDENLGPVLLPESVLIPTNEKDVYARGILYHVHKAGTSSATLPLRLIMTEGPFKGYIFAKMTTLKDCLKFVGTGWTKIVFERNTTVCLEDARTRLANETLPKSFNKPLPSGLDAHTLFLPPKEFTAANVEKLDSKDLASLEERFEPILGGAPITKKNAFSLLVESRRKVIKRVRYGMAPSTVNTDISDFDAESEAASTETRKSKRLKPDAKEETEVSESKSKSSKQPKINKRNLTTLQRRSLKVGKAMSLLLDNKCSVCLAGSGRSTRSKLVQCQACLAYTHVECYGNPLLQMARVDTSSWVCASCQDADTAKVCVLCGLLGSCGSGNNRSDDSKNTEDSVGLGLMKRTVDFRW